MAGGAEGTGSPRGGRPSGPTRTAVMLAVRDADRSVAFYRDVMEFEAVDYPHIPLLRRGNLELFLVEESPPTADRPGVALAAPADVARMPVNLVLEVGDARAEYERLRGRGLRFLTPPARPPWGGWRCFAQDPDGYLIEVEQPPEGTSTASVAHTADLDGATLEAARALLYEVFDDMTEPDWEHALGGMHALVWQDGELIGHAALIGRRLLHAGRALRAGYVEGVAVRAGHRRRGHGAAMMDALERLIRGGHDLGALGASDEGAAFYASRGWRRWEGTTWALTPNGPVRTAEEDGYVFVLPLAAPLDLAGDLTCDWRDGELW